MLYALSQLSLPVLKIILKINHIRAPGITFYGRLPIISNRGKATFGQGCRFGGYGHRSILTIDKGAELLLGDRVFMNEGLRITVKSSVTIGDGCLIGEMVSISDTGFHNVSEGKPTKIARIAIGRNVWIGRNSMIMPGVTIGDHAVVGAGSIVTRSIAARTVVGGAPAKPISAVVCSDAFIR